MNTLAIVGKFLRCSVDAGFVLALPLHHGDLELDSVGVAILVAWPWLGGNSTSALAVVSSPAVGGQSC